MNTFKPILRHLLALAVAAAAMGPLAHAADSNKDADRSKAVKASAVEKTRAAVEKTRACEAQKVQAALAGAQAVMTPVSQSPTEILSETQTLGPIYPGVCAYACEYNCWRTRDCPSGTGPCVRYCP